MEGWRTYRLVGACYFQDLLIVKSWTEPSREVEEIWIE
jgi:hypothetical protein